VEARVVPGRRRLVVGIVILLAAVWLVAAAVTVVSIRANAESGVERLEATRSATDDLVALLGDERDDSPTPDQIARDLDAAAADLRAAAGSTDSWLLAPMRVTPVVGRQLSAVATILGTTSAATEAVAAALRELDGLGARAATDPEQRLASVEQVAAILGRLADDLREPDLGPEEGLQTTVASVRNRAATELEQASATVDSAAAAANGVSDLLRGPNTYLVLAANNAEMRAGSGMFLQVGTVTFVDGRIELSEFTPAEELVLDAPGASLDPDVAARWGGLAPDREFRNLNLTPRFDESARMATELWAAAGRGEVDGVMAIDVVALRRLLELVGPIEVVDDDEVRTLTPEQAQSFLLTEQYAAFDERDDRREVLGSLLSAAFGAFNDRPVAATGLLDFLDRSGAGRHLLMWSPNDAEQTAWRELGVAGELTPDALMLSLINRAANKLDPYVELSAELTSADGPDGRSLAVEVTVRNSAPAGLSDYVAGPRPIAGAVDAGDYVGVLALTVPGSAGNLTVEGGGGLAVLGDDGPTRVVGTNLRVPAGGTSSVRFGLVVPATLDELTVLPSARVPRTSWTAGDQEWTEGRQRTIALDRVG